MALLDFLRDEEKIFPERRKRKAIPPQLPQANPLTPPQGNPFLEKSSADLQRLSQQAMQEQAQAAQQESSQLQGIGQLAGILGPMFAGTPAASDLFTQARGKAGATGGLLGSPSVYPESTPNVLGLEPNRAASTGTSSPAFDMGTLFSGLSKAFPTNPLMQQVGATQAILESGLMGKPSKLATDMKNLFGIKGSGTAGSATLGTKEFQGGKMTPARSSFGSYNTFQDSINQYANLMGKPRYSGVMSAQSPEQAFDALQKAGYATDPNYRAKLMSVYRRYVAPKFSGGV